MKKRVLSIVLALALLSTMSVMSVSAAVPDEGIEPCYETIICGYCGTSARVLDRQTRDYCGTSSVPAGGCKLNSNLGSHQHSLYRDYITISCPNCGTVDLHYSSYAYCPIAGGYIY